MRSPLLYDAVMAPFERTVLGRRRARAFGTAGGRVLEIGGGTGCTLPHYREASGVVLSDAGPAMLGRAVARARPVSFPVRTVAADAAALPFRAVSFDTVVVSLAMCTVAEPERAFAEIRRVLTPDGELRTLEHIRCASPWYAALQDVLTPVWQKLSGGCRLNRPTLGISDPALGNAVGLILAALVASSAPRLPSLATSTTRSAGQSGNVRLILSGRSVATSATSAATITNRDTRPPPPGTRGTRPGRRTKTRHSNKPAGGARDAIQGRCNRRTRPRRASGRDRGAARAGGEARSLAQAQRAQARAAHGHDGPVLLERDERRRRAAVALHGTGVPRI